MVVRRPEVAARHLQDASERMFEDVLRNVVTNVDGALCCSIMGFDGIVVETERAPRATIPTDLETAWVEYANAMQQLRASVSPLGTGELSECALHTAGTTTIIRLLNDDYFVALGLLPTGNYGKGRYLLRLAASSLAREL